MKKGQEKFTAKKNLARPLNRLLAFLGDLSLGHLASYLLLSLPAYSHGEELLTKNLKPFAETFHFSSDLLAFLIYWLFLTQIIRFIHTLLFGVSPFELLAGFRSSGPWWWRRIAGGARVLVGFFTTPFLVFDVPLLLRKPTLKESWTGSFLYQPPSKKAWRLFAVVPLLLLFSLTAPLFKDLALVDGMVVSFETVEKEDLDKGANFSNFRTYASERFHLKTFSSLANGRFSLFPDFEFIKARSKKRLSPFLLIYDHKTKSVGEFKVDKKINLLDLLEIGIRGNPLFASSFPALARALASDRALFEERLWKEGQENNALMDPMVREDIQNLVKASFKLGMGNIVGHILTYGPFLRGFIDLRHALLSLTVPGTHPEVDLLTMGNVEFLRFRQSFSDDMPMDKQVLETYMPIGTHNSMTMILGWDKSLQGALSANSFRQTFLANGEWYFDYENFFTKPKLEADINAFYALDLLIKKDKKQSRQEILEEFLYRYYYQKCRKAIKSEDPQLLKSLRYNIIRLSSIMELKVERDKKAYSTLFLNQWRELWNSFQARDKGYFNI